MILFNKPHLSFFIFYTIIILLIIFSLIIYNKKSDLNGYYLKNIDGYLQKVKCDLIFIAQSIRLNYMRTGCLIDENKYTKSNLFKLIDPFSSKAYMYKRLSDNSFMVYSIGPDCIDDGGKILNYRNLFDNKTEFYYVSKKDGKIRGDIVLFNKPETSILDFDNQWKIYETQYDAYSYIFVEDFVTSITKIKEIIEKQDFPHEIFGESEVIHYN